ncbi:MAG: HVO_0476 family zinc finger protein [Methanohalobium sp.]|uniref:HVO_0476 family zinc finger protein n=1 Tax=Methanohalobium sp. TaxID=2837493 RepID=UPI00397AF2D2
MDQEIEIECPSCSPDIPVLHEVLKSGQNVLVKCEDCGEIHSPKTEKEKPVYIKTIISKGEKTFTHTNQMYKGEVLDVDDELVVDDGVSEDVYPIVVTSIESQGKRVESAKVDDIDSIWGRAIDEVDVKITVHSEQETYSMTKRFSGGREFVVGEKYNFDDISFIVTRIKIRNGGFRIKEGDVVEAKNIKRLFAQEIFSEKYRGRTAWSMKWRGRGL